MVEEVFGEGSKIKTKGGAGWSVLSFFEQSRTVKRKSSLSSKNRARRLRLSETLRLAILVPTDPLRARRRRLCGRSDGKACIVGASGQQELQ